MHGHHRLVFLEGTATNTTQLLHVSTASKQVANVHTESTHISASFAADPKDAHITLIVILNELSLVDSSDSELFLDG